MIVLKSEELPGLSTPEVDKIIDAVYQNTVETGATAGSLTMQKYDATNDVSILLGPPSPASIQKLHALEDNYLWSVEPF